jgi:3-hydroxyacyl-[acyl-carrier-protein] dehydratase
MIISIKDILKLLPHRYPFLLLERLENIKPHESATGIKNVSINEPFFQGHFPENPIMPGVLIIEFMAQTAGALVLHSLGLDDLHNLEKHPLVYFMSIENARFRKPVLPGDCLSAHVEKRHMRKNVWRFQGTASVGDAIVAEATYTAMITNDQNFI